MGLNSSKLLKNITILTSGTFVAQLIPLLSAPILTRLFTPEDFGLMTLFGTITTLFSVIFTFGYENSIVSIEKNKENEAVFSTSIILCFFLCLLLQFFLFLFFFINETFAFKINIIFIFLPVSIFLLSIFKYQRFWYNFKGNFKQISSNQIFNNLFDNIFKIIFGLANINFGLIVGGICGRLIIIITISIKIFRELSKNLKLENLKDKISLLKKHKYFPIHVMPAGLINILSFDVPIIFISFYFGNTYLGLFSLAHRVITLPTILLAKSVGDVYRKLIFDFKVEQKILLPTFLKFLKNNILLSILPCILIYLFIDDIITIVFGQNWHLAGQYSKILIFYAFFQFIVTPLDKGAIILNHTKYYFNWTLFRLLLQIILSVISIFYDFKITHFLWGLVFCNILVYLIDLYYQYTFIVKHDQSINKKY